MPLRSGPRPDAASGSLPRRRRDGADVSSALAWERRECHGRFRLESTGVGVIVLT